MNRRGQRVHESLPSRSDGQRTNRQFWLAFWSVILLLAAVYGYVQWYIFQDARRVALEAQGRLAISEAALEDWAKTLPELLSFTRFEIDDEARTKIGAVIDREVTEVFAYARRQVPKLADFHYSLTGEYTELVVALTSSGVSSLQRIVFDDVDFQGRLDKMNESVSRESTEILSAAISDIREKFQQSMEFSEQEMAIVSEVFALAMVDVESRFSAELNSLRAGGAIAGAYLATTLAAKKASQSIVAKVAAKAAAKTAAKVITPGAVAGTAAFGCSWLGPWGAVACGAVAGLGAWLTTDVIILRLDELLNREEFEADVTRMLDRQEAEMKQAIKKSHGTVLDALSTDFCKRLRATTPAELLMEKCGG